MAATASEKQSAELTADKAKVRNILLPLDGSENAERAFEWYLKNLNCEHDRLHFVHAIEPVYTSPAIGILMETPMLPDLSKLLSDDIDKGKTICRAAMEKAKSLNIACDAHILVHHKVGEAILAYLKENDINLVVMGNRGIGAIRRTFLGSVSDYVLHQAHIPVLIVPPPEPN